MCVQHRLSVAFVVFTALLSGCESPAAPEVPELGSSPFSNCLRDDGVEICIEKSVYSPLEWVPFTISNGLDRAVFEDRCSGGVQGRRSPSEEWSSNLGTARLCVAHADHEDVLTWMRPLPQAELVTDSFSVTGQAYEGEWRVWILVLDSTGIPVRDQPFTSRTFTVDR